MIDTVELDEELHAPEASPSPEALLEAAQRRALVLGALEEMYDDPSDDLSDAAVALMLLYGISADRKERVRDIAARWRARCSRVRRLQRLGESVLRTMLAEVV